MIGPALAEWQPAYLIGLAGAALNAGVVIATKTLERNDPAVTVMFYLGVVFTVLSLPALTLPWPLHLWPWLLAVVIMGPACLYFGILAVRYADVSLLAPYDYTRLIFAALLAFVLFGEVPSLTALAGAAVISLSCVWIALPPHGKQKRATI